jgi:UDP-glucose 4-epimerase
MKHLLIGGAGFLGRHLASELLARGDEVVVYDNYSFSDLSKSLPPEVELITAEATNEAALSSTLLSFNPDNVVWLAYFFSYDPSNIPHVRHSWLMHGLVKALQVLYEFKGTRFVYVSSDLVYKPAAPLIKETSAVNWGSPNTFVTNKLIAESYITTTCKNLKIPWAIIRPSIVVGKRDYIHPAADPLTFMVFSLVSGQSLLIKSSQQKRDYILVGQACEMMANLLCEKDCKGFYNLSSGLGTTNLELIQLLTKMVRPKILPKVLESREGDLVLDNSKIMALGEVKITSFVDELPNIVEHRKALVEE